VPDTLAWIAKLAERFDVTVSPYASVVFDEVSKRCFGGMSYASIGERAKLPQGTPAPVAQEPGPRADPPVSGGGLRLVSYRPLFTGPAVERTPELQFQRPDAVVELAAADARSRGIRNGATVTVSSNGTSIELRARIARDLGAGTVRIARDHAADLHAVVEVQP